MRKLLIAPLVLPLAFLAWPLAAAWQLRVAVKAGDIAAIESKVDWTTLRANLKQTVGGNLKEKSANPQRGLIKRVLIGTIGPRRGRCRHRLHRHAADARQGAGRPQPARRSRHDAPARAPALQRRRPPTIRPADPLAPRRLRWAFFESPTRFRIEAVDRKMPGKRVVSILALQGVRWKLVDVYYLTPA